MEGEQKAKPLQGNGALVTGAGSGIGREIALRLAEDGAAVVVGYSSNSAGAADSVAAIKALGPPPGLATAVKADVRDAAEVVRLFDSAEAFLGHAGLQLHGVVNNAGALDDKYLKLADTSPEAWDAMFSLNARGTFLCSREAACRVARGGGGRIVNVTSTAVATAPAGYAAYAASKAALETMTRVLAAELRGSRLTANCVSPGPVETGLFYRGKSTEAVAAFSPASPLERLGTVGDVAPVVAFLASEQGEWVNAQIICVNGGLA